MGDQLNSHPSMKGNDQRDIWRRSSGVDVYMSEKSRYDVRRWCMRKSGDTSMMAFGSIVGLQITPLKRCTQFVIFRSIE